MKTISKTIKFEDSLELECGTVLPSFELIFETYGELNKDKSNEINLPEYKEAIKKWGLISD